jgi:hypothetical protein
MSSTLSPKENSRLLDETADGSKPEKINVSQSQYDEAMADKSGLEKQLKSLQNMAKFAKILPDGGEKVKKRIEILIEQLDGKKLLIDQMEVDENRTVLAVEFSRTTWVW